MIQHISRRIIPAVYHPGNVIPDLVATIFYGRAMTPLAAEHVAAFCQQPDTPRWIARRDVHTQALYVLATECLARMEDDPEAPFFIDGEFQKVWS